ncbi:MAG: type II secretion system protein [Verrucomicrobiota bacterium]
MNPRPHTLSRKALAAFTMTELALCIAVIGIALVAIIGVLPSGLNVQKENREDTLIAEDAKYLLECIRSGSVGVADLTNYVERVDWTRRGLRVNEQHFFYGATYDGPRQGGILLTNPLHVVALLSLPREEPQPDGRTVTNLVVAQFRSFSSPFSQKPYPEPGGVPPSPRRLDLALRYQVLAECIRPATRPAFVVNQAPTNAAALQRQQFHLDAALTEVRLAFQWPLVQVGNTVRAGNNRRVFRTQTLGRRELVSPNFYGTDLRVTRLVPDLARSPLN